MHPAVLDDARFCELIGDDRMHLVPNRDIGNIRQDGENGRIGVDADHVLENEGGIDVQVDRSRTCLRFRSVSVARDHGLRSGPRSIPN